MKYKINSLKEWDQFVKDLMEIQAQQPRTFSKFPFSNSFNEFYWEFDNLNNSRTLYVDGDGSGNFTEYYDEKGIHDNKNIYDKERDAAEVRAYSEVEIGCGRFVRLYGNLVLSSWDDKYEYFEESFFTNYDCVEIV